MNNSMSFFAGLLFSFLILVACASTLEHPYFGLGMVESCFDQGTLLGVDGKGNFESSLNEPLSTCKNFTCLVMKLRDHERLESDLVACRSDLKACEEN